MKTMFGADGVLTLIPFDRARRDQLDAT